MFPNRMFQRPGKSLSDQEDGVINATSDGCGGGDSPCLNVLTNNYLVITFDQSYQLDKIVLYVGCEDKETMGGKIINLATKNLHGR